MQEEGMVKDKGEKQQGMMRDKGKRHKEGGGQDEGGQERGRVSIAITSINFALIPLKIIYTQC